MAPGDLTDFEVWLTNCGAEVLAPTSTWEILRVRTSTGTHVVHSNKKGDQKWPPALLDIVSAYNKGITLALAATKRRRGNSKLMQNFPKLVSRDGPGCFYCGHLVPTPSDKCGADYAPTIEHLVSTAHGGPNHLSNKFLSHFRCNQIAGHLSAPEKIALREKMRAERV